MFCQLFIAACCCVPFVAADFPAPTFTIDLDEPPETRWVEVTKEIINKHGWDNSWGLVMNYLKKLLPLETWQKNDKLLLDLLYKRFPGQYAAEVHGMWTVWTEMGYGKEATESMIAFMQLYYEVRLPLSLSFLSLSVSDVFLA